MHAPLRSSPWWLLVLLGACVVSPGDPNASDVVPARQRDTTIADPTQDALPLPPPDSREAADEDATSSIPDVPAGGAGDPELPMSGTSAADSLGAGGEDATAPIPDVRSGCAWDSAEPAPETVVAGGDTAAEAPDAGAPFPCELTTDCGAGFMCEGSFCVPISGTPCVASDDCPSDLLCVAGTCGGCQGCACSGYADCLEPLECFAGTCAYAPVAGGACADSTDCPSGLVCAADGSAICTPPGSLGTPCGDDGDCASTVCRTAVGDPAPACAASGLVCSSLGVSGEPCSVGGVCAEDHGCEQTAPGCLGTCRAYGEEGQPCLVSPGGYKKCSSAQLVCNEALAPGGICMAPGETGTPCLNSSHCARGFVCGSATGSSVCHAPTEAGSACALTIDCKAGLQCDRGVAAALGVCRVPAPAGAPCVSPYACADGLTCLPGPDGATCALGDKPCEDGDWCPKGFSCLPAGGATKYCTALYAYCSESSSCPLGYECRSVVGGFNGSCIAWFTYCLMYKSTSWMCDSQCGLYCSEVTGCEGNAQAIGAIDYVCGQCVPQPGTRLPGAPCIESADCAGVLGCIAGACVDVLPGALCLPYVWGGQCNKDQWCTGGSCAAAIAVGQACTTDAECGAAICTGVCTPPGAIGEPCDSGPCGPNLECGAAGVCVALSAFLEPCDGSANCSDNLLCHHSVCTFYGESYGPCKKDSDCLSGRCDNTGSCSPECKVDEDCLAPRRCFGPSGHFCQMPRSPGAQCSADDQCASFQCVQTEPCKGNICL